MANVIEKAKAILGGGDSVPDPMLLLPEHDDGRKAKDAAVAQEEANFAEAKADVERERQAAEDKHKVFRSVRVKAAARGEGLKNNADVEKARASAEQQTYRAEEATDRMVGLAEKLIDMKADLFNEKCAAEQRSAEKLRAVAAENVRARAQLFEQLVILTARSVRIADALHRLSADPEVDRRVGRYGGLGSDADEVLYFGSPAVGGPHWAQTLFVHDPNYGFGCAYNAWKQTAIRLGLLPKE